jgi:subtilase family serine protease
MMCSGLRRGALVGSAALSVVGAIAMASAAVPTVAASTAVPRPTVSDYQQMTTSETPPTQAQCNSATPFKRRCFTPQSTRAAYNVLPLYAQGYDGSGQTIAIIDSYGSDTMAHDLHVYDQAFGLQPMCGEEGVTCAAGMPKFSELHVQGSPATKAPPANSKGTGQEDKSAWALEVALDVETAHAMTPKANILLVTTPTAETLGVQGFPQMMNAEQYVVDHHLATVISQSFAAAEESFGSSASLEQLRHAYKSAEENGVTVLGSSGDGGTANSMKSPVGGPNASPLIPHPTVVWPASDPLVTGVGGTYLCTDATATSARVLDNVSPPANCQGQSEEEVGWIGSGGGFSSVFTKPGYQNALPSGSTAIGTMRGVPDIGLQASSRTGALVYLSLPPDGLSGLICGSSPCSTGWYDIGGTSLSCPQWAGLIAIADQIKGHGLGLINPALYQLASNPATYAKYFFDVTTGNNQTVSSIPGYPATTGWDPVTGLGTPNAANLLPDLAAAS